MGILDKILPSEIPLPSVTELVRGVIENRHDLNMNEIVGTHDILFICLDCLRYDVALSEQENGGTPVLNQYGAWEKRGAAGNFTYPSHQAMFAGFLPTSLEPTPMNKKKMLFFQKGIGLGKVAPPRAFTFEEPTFIQGLEKVGYETICIGGVSFFSRRSALGSVFPDMFKQSFWYPSFGCTVKESPDNQITKAVSVLEQTSGRVMMYVNFDAIHYPSHFYVKGAKKDSLETHAAALRYIDERLPRLFEAFQKRGKTFVIACSDHGTCYEESDDGYLFHGFNHDTVMTVPYKQFFL
ncbi:MAG: STM4013/SEN3800 family hydrolase [Defluviitaleaceae bacterium]|nr:STM4013/SEN3800 family hydrolase [Defluviitaleaceae bacterium]